MLFNVKHERRNIIHYLTQVSQGIDFTLQLINNFFHGYSGYFIGRAF